MARRRPWLAVPVVLALLVPGVPVTGQEAVDPVPVAPLDSPLVERAGAELAQFDVTVRGSAEAIAALAPGDFRIRVGGTRLASYRMDRLCPSVAGGAAVEDPPPPDGPPEVGPPGRPADERPSPSYLLYFDQMLLTQAGRQRAIDLSRDLVPDLVASGGAVTLVSSAGEVTAFAEGERDAAEVLAALDRLETDGRQWDPYASFESNRVDEVLRDLNRSGSLELAIQTARRHQRYERWITERSLRRLDHTLGRLAGVPPPKAVVYFADTLRSNAGEHYLSFFSDGAIATTSSLPAMEADALTATLPFDAILEKAAALGIRFYTVHAQGLSLDVNRERLSMSRIIEAGKLEDASTVRTRHAQDSMASLARETGGEVFLHAPRGDKIAARILDDLACVFVFSFDPGPFDRDRPLRLRVRTEAPGIEVAARGQIVIQSPEARDENRLLAAFVAPDSDGTASFDLGDGLIPIDYLDGRYRALLQVRVPAIPFTEAVWDLGASLVPDRGGEVADVSARVRIPPPGAPAVFEREVRFRPGEVRLVTVAHETGSDRIASSRTPTSWSDPDARAATIGPVVLLQPAAAVFVRDGEVRGGGSLFLADGDDVEVGLPAALVTLVCRGPRMRRPIRVERALVGPADVRFEPAEVEPGEHRCVQVRDVVPAGSLSPGSFVYRVRATVAGREYDSGERRFVAVDDGPPGT